MSLMFIILSATYDPLEQFDVFNVFTKMLYIAPTNLTFVFIFNILLLIFCFEFANIVFHGHQLISVGAYNLYKLENYNIMY
jgi:hypothetical protein